MVAAGIANPTLADERMRNLARDILRSGKALEDFALAVADDIEIVTLLCAPVLAQVQHEVRDGKGQISRTDGHDSATHPSAHAPSSDAVAGQTISTTDGQVAVTRHRPGHARPRDPAALRSVAKTVATTLLDTFAIIDRNGERMPVGDIYVSSYNRLIHMTGKRSWRASREHALLNLLKAEVDRKAAYLPPETKTRDIFAADDIERLLTTATSLATPKLSEADAA